MADTPAPSKSSAPSFAPSGDQRKAAYDFCEKALRDFDAIAVERRPQGFSISRSQTLTGDTIQRTFILNFELKLTGCEFPDQ